MFGKDVFTAFFSTKGNVRRSDPQLMRRMSVTVNYNGSVLLSSAKMSVVASEIYIFPPCLSPFAFLFSSTNKNIPR